jgi:predicted dienelactone hydrolase
MAHLAREGFIVVAPFHGHTKQSAVVRPRQINQALDAALADPRISAHADPTRTGMIGFSLGGAVTLINAGGIPNPVHFAAYCADHREDQRACGPGPGGGSANAAPARDPSASALPRIDPLSLRAIVLLDPGPIALFDHDGLAKVDMPVLLYRPEKSDLRAEGNVLALAAALPRSPQLETIPGGHFIFVDVCSPELRAQTADVCEDPPGVDRAAVHAHIQTDIAKFLHDNL